MEKKYVRCAVPKQSEWKNQLPKMEKHLVWMMPGEFGHTFSLANLKKFRWCQNRPFLAPFVCGLLQILPLQLYWYVARTYQLCGTAFV